MDYSDNYANKHKYAICKYDDVSRIINVVQYDDKYKKLKCRTCNTDMECVNDKITGCKSFVHLNKYCEIGIKCAYKYNYICDINKIVLKDYYGNINGYDEIDVHNYLYHYINFVTELSSIKTNERNTINIYKFDNWANHYKYDNLETSLNTDNSTNWSSGYKTGNYKEVIKLVTDDNIVFLYLGEKIIKTIKDNEYFMNPKTPLYIDIGVCMLEFISLSLNDDIIVCRELPYHLFVYRYSFNEKIGFVAANELCRLKKEIHGDEKDYIDANNYFYYDYKKKIMFIKGNVPIKKDLSTNAFKKHYVKNPSKKIAKIRLMRNKIWVPVKYVLTYFLDIFIL